MSYIVLRDPELKVAAQTASAFNPHVRINPIHANIKDPQFDMSWFRTFDIVLNALDNLGVQHGKILPLFSLILTCRCTDARE